jgi:hypothetical protein
MHIGFPVKYLLFLSSVNKSSIFSIGFRKKNTKILHFVSPSGGSRVVSVRADGQRNRRTDMTKLVVALRNFAKGPKSYTTTANLVGVYRTVGHKGN